MAKTGGGDPNREAEEHVNHLGRERFGAIDHRVGALLCLAYPFLTIF